MNRQQTRKITAVGLVVILLLSTGCAMPPWRAKQTAQRDAAQDYIERTAANIQYDTDMAAPNATTTSYSAASTNAYGSSSNSAPPRSASSSSGGSCCH
ncbi:hypothetical protein [Aureliella helgolandensis]|uniref:Lipoprotein n=1 Tax=Aureliella helgolandensis TaxID=2527968 RepID=A0A518GBK5_9BACT|nr:hypothetical protein [Aureliella helgolandensis]QDV25975.1 hypothetical protein Q31a_43450 [Aureliella helgolandensis]